MKYEILTYVGIFIILSAAGVVIVGLALESALIIGIGEVVFAVMGLVSFLIYTTYLFKTRGKPLTPSSIVRTTNDKEKLFEEIKL